MSKITIKFEFRLPTIHIHAASISSHDKCLYKDPSLHGMGPFGKLGQPGSSRQVDHQLTMFGPNRVAADMEENGEFDFIVIFWRHFLRFLEKI